MDLSDIISSLGVAVAFVFGLRAREHQRHAKEPSEEVIGIGPDFLNW